jgi:hypothetical protein
MRTKTYFILFWIHFVDFLLGFALPLLGGAIFYSAIAITIRGLTRFTIFVVGVALLAVTSAFSIKRSSTRPSAIHGC